MGKKREESDFPTGKVRFVKDFLPPPEELVIPGRETVKVTLHLSQDSVQFFKREAAKHHTKYQRMIRQLIDRYMEYYVHEG
jgi:hypothetical protein